ncbi:hypothetical protein H6G06_25445 [Anabaena sphaerica FACHB-251]|uniref:Uncharacterized protein n=1 Tax=Anabaena sphaerica FACHB-251 TaxID=2692883 RepID=A0A927A3Y7_9NOST|nr:hypothetical protein [Anabaena sphaerica]MBD2296736.1 hypothetical protein [Anabaena sphaerica FACHB-251]
MAKLVTSTQKAVKAVIHLGSIPLDVYQMPDGDYKLYIESVTAAIDRPNNDLLRFLSGKSPQALPYKNRNLLQDPMVEVEGYGGYIKPIPVELATGYWFYRAIKGSLIAQAIIQASLAESIERRADAAFEFKRTEKEYNQKFGERLEEVLAYNTQDIVDRRLPGDDLYLPPGIN